MSAAVAITNLLYRYAELMDAGDLEGVAGLFRFATVRLSGGQIVDSDGLLAVWREYVKLYPCGTPRTKHVITNVLLHRSPGDARLAAAGHRGGPLS